MLQKVNRNSAGNYTCIAYNAEGMGESNAFGLNVLCKYTYLLIFPQKYKIHMAIIGLAKPNMGVHYYSLFKMRNAP